MKYLFLFFTSFLFGQQTQKVDFISMQAFLKPNAINKTISGKGIYNFNVKSSIDTIKIDAQEMSFTSVKINNIEVKFKNTGKELQFFGGFKKGKNTLVFEYAATPKKTLYFVGKGDNLQIWTQGQGFNTSHWLPSFDDVNEKVIFNLSIEYRNDFEVISNGKLTDTKINSKGNIKTWNYQMKKPMSSYLVMMAIGKFDKEIIKSKSGITSELYFKPEDKDKVASTYKHSKEIFDFLEKEIEVKYPWEVYKQVPINDFLFGGMENTTATIFAQDYMVDEIGNNDRSYINVDAHEVAHHWFGDLITAKSWKHGWLQEGFATYYELLAEKEFLGDDHFNYLLLKMSEQLKEVSKTDLTAIINEKGSPLFYKKAAWALYVLDVNIGHKNFQKAVKNFLVKYQYKNVTTDDFLAEVKKVTHYDVDNFKKVWLEEAGFRADETIEIVSKNAFVKQYLSIQQLKNTPFSEKKTIFITILKSDAFYPVKQEIINQLAEIPFDDKKELLLLVLQSNDLKVRQAVAKTTTTIPQNFKQEYETLLNDNSHYTRQYALTNLWNQFPEDRVKYLNLSKEWIGFNNKNLRTIWLKFALQTQDYQPESRTHFYSELVKYTASDFESSIRQKAFESLLQSNLADERVLLSLVSSTTHIKRQFTKYGRDAILELIKKEGFRKKINELIPMLSDEEKVIVSNLLSEK